MAAAVRADQPRPSRAEAEQAVQDAAQPISARTPTARACSIRRAASSRPLTSSIRATTSAPAEVLNRTFGETAGYDDFVLVRDIEFTSQCEHHMMPFYGKAHIAYTPVERVVGLSKLARLTDIFARRLQTQGAPHRPDRGRDRRGPEAARRCRADRGGAYLHVGARRRQAWRDRPSPAASPACSATIRRSSSVSCPWCEDRTGNLAQFFERGLPCPHRPTITTAKRGWRSSPNSTRPSAHGLRRDRCRDRRRADGRAHERRSAAQDDRDRRGLVLQPLAQCVVAQGRELGQTQRVVEIRTDCDQDAVWIKVEQIGAACHTGRRSCFYRAVKGEGGDVSLAFVDADRLFDPARGLPRSSAVQAGFLPAGTLLTCH